MLPVRYHKYHPHWNKDYPERSSITSVQPGRLAHSAPPQHASFSSLQASCGQNHHIHQRLNLGIFEDDRSIRQLAVVIEQLLN